jgi:mono/diheme cytochrome c family protein
MWNHGPAMAEAMRARSIERPAFADTELRDLIAYLRSTATAAPEGPIFVLPGRADTGRRLFAEKRCVDCHGVGARGGVGPELAERGHRWSLTQFAAAMWNKAPAMQEAMKARGLAVPQLAPDEMADIVAYLYALHYFAEPGDAQRGAAVARAKGCLGCHTVGGGRAPADLTQVRGLDSPAAILAGLWNHSFVERPAARARAGWPELRVEEMADLMTYLQSVGRMRGR